MTKLGLAVTKLELAVTKLRLALTTTLSGPGWAKHGVHGAFRDRRDPLENLRVCATPLPARTIGRPARFCSAGHRVAYHRLAKRTPSPIEAPRAPAPPPKSRAAALSALADLAIAVDDLAAPIGRVSALRHMADYADDLSTTLDELDHTDWLFDWPETDQELAELRDALQDLEAHRHTLERLADLRCLADDMLDFRRDLKVVQRHRSDIDDAIYAIEVLSEEDT